MTDFAAVSMVAPILAVRSGTGASDQGFGGALDPMRSRDTRSYVLRPVWCRDASVRSHRVLTASKVVQSRALIG